MRKFALYLLYAAVAINIAVPKAGIKVGDLPLTAGNFVVAILFVVCVVAALSGARLRSMPLTGIVAVMIAFFFVRFVLVYGSGSLDIGAVSALVIYPALFFAITNVVRTAGELTTLLKIIALSAACVIAYGLLQSVVGINTIAVPGLTVNLTDYQSSSEWYLEKHNRVGDSTKLVSTYQNGNLLGVNLLLVAPIALGVLKRSFWRGVYIMGFILVVLLTLSRSAWFGLAFSLAAYLLVTRTTTRFGSIVRVGGLGLAVLLVPIALNLFPQITTRFAGTDAEALDSLGGRWPAAEAMLGWMADEVLPLLFGGYGSSAMVGGAYEMTYIAVLMYGGIIGLGLFLTVQCVAAVQSWHGGGTGRYVLVGLVGYSAAAILDGGFWLPPAALNFWLVVSLAVLVSRLKRAGDESVIAPRFSVPFDSVRRRSVDVTSPRAAR